MHTEVRTELAAERPDKSMLASGSSDSSGSGSSGSGSSGSGSSGSGSYGSGSSGSGSSGSGSSGSGSSGSSSSEQSPEALAKEGEIVAADAEVAVKQVGGSGSGGNGVYLFINSAPMGGIEQKARQARGRGPARSLSWEGMESVSQSGGGEQLTTDTGVTTEVKVEKLGS